MGRDICTNVPAAGENPHTPEPGAAMTAPCPVSCNDQSAASFPRLSARCYGLPAADTPSCRSRLLCAVQSLLSLSGLGRVQILGSSLHSL